MGYHCTWIATRGSPADVVLAALGLDRIDSRSEAVFDPGIFGVDLPGGWFLVLADGWEHMDSLSEKHAIELLSSHECWFFLTDDTSMCARLAAYADGYLAWSITYDGSNGSGMPTVDGTPPAVVTAELRNTRDRQLAAGDRGVDHIYDFPAGVADRLLGFRHDRTLADGEFTPIQILARRP